MLSPLILLLAQPAGLDVAGLWTIPPDEEGGPDRGTVEIVMEDGAPVGRIASVGEAFRGTPEEEAALGLAILWGFERDEEDARWEGGRILDPEADKTYKAKIRREGDTLSVKGCVAFFCREQVWLPADPAPGVTAAP